MSNDGKDNENAAIMGLAGVLISTGDLASMTRFYRDVLGLKARSERGRYTNFEWNGVRLNISLHSEVSGQSGDPLRFMLHFAVEDIHAAYERLRAAGVVFTRPPEREKWGGWVATFHDPDGNTLQLLQQP